MSNYKYAVSFYRSTLPLSHRTVRSSSVERSSYGTSDIADRISGRWNRASTVGPSTLFDNPDYYGVMPFNRSLAEIEDRIRLRSASMEPVSTYRRSYYTTTPYGAQTSYDYKVMDYASRLDNEETTRNYMNQMRSDYRSRSVMPSYTSSYSGSAYNPAYDSYLRGSSNFPGAYTNSSAYNSALDSARERRSNIDLDSFKLNSRDLYSYKHYRKSTATLTDRNERAKSPVVGRELDRYYNTNSRSSYLGDVSSGGHRDFRYYNFRSVPYYGGSDYYSYVDRTVRGWRDDIRRPTRTLSVKRQEIGAEDI